MRNTSTSPSKQPLLWLLMGTRAGDNNQLLALASALGWPYEAKHIDFNALRHLPTLRSGLTIVADNSRRLVSPPWPNVVIGVGYGSVCVARYIREQSGGRAKLVHVGNPRERLDDFDLQITTPQYWREPAPNLLELPFAIGNPARSARPSLEEYDWLRRFQRPLRLIAVGGPARYWELDDGALEDAVRTIQDKQPRGSLIVATSYRTRQSTQRMLERLASGPHEALVEHFPSFSTLLAECDEVHVTADSVSMLSEAILSGKPVGMIPIKRSFRGKLSWYLWQKPLGKVAFPDFPNFWALLHRNSLIGTVELPIPSQVCDTVGCAADAVRALVAPGDSVDEGRTRRGDQHLGVARRPRGRQRSGNRAGGSDRPAVSDEAIGI